MKSDNNREYKYKGVTVKISWCPYQEIYHWEGFQWGEKLQDSLKQPGFESEQEALIHAKKEIDFFIGA